jgi:hypothetical protein
VKSKPSSHIFVGYALRVFPQEESSGQDSVEANPLQFISLFSVESGDISSVRIRFDQSSDILDVSLLMPIEPSKEFDYESG